MFPRPAIDPTRWRQLSPLLDELMELDDPMRAARLQALRTTDPLAATELEALLGSMQAARSERFLEQRAAGLPDAGVAAGPGAGLGAGSACGAWTLMHPLGTGGMGTVWLARRTDGRYDAQAAIKLPHPGVLAHGGAERFEREGRLLARLSHPHIAALLDAGVAASGQPYLVLEAVHGVPIDRHCDDHRLTVPARIALFLDVLAAVAHAHGQFVLHRDLKPSNILIDAHGGVKLLDFGIARLIDAGADAAADGASTRIFTPDHASPEQLQGRAVGVPADVYALGVLLYQLLAGRHPTARPAQTPMERLRAVADTVPVPASEAAREAGAEVAGQRSIAPRQLVRLLRGDLDTILAKALKKEPGERYASAAAFADDLRRWRDGWPVLARPDRLGHRLRLAVRRHRVVAVSSLVAVALLIGGTVTTAWQAMEARRERDDARWQAERAQARSSLYNMMLGQMGGLDTPLTQRQVLDNAVRLVESRYAGQPRLAVELLLPIAGQYHTLGDVPADLRVMQLAARLADASGDAELVGRVACSTVDTHIKLDRLTDAEAALGRGLAAIAGLAAPSPTLQVECWRYEAQLALELGQRQRALAAGLRARQQLERSGSTDGNNYTSVLAELMYFYRNNGDVPAALATADQLAALHRARSGGRSLDEAVVDLGRAALLADAGEVVAAHRLAADAAGRFGTDEAAPFVLYNLARLELVLARVDSAGALATRAGTAGRAGPGAEFEAQLAYLQLLVALAEGRPDAGRRWYERLQQASGRRALRAVTPTPETAHASLLQAEGRTAAAVETIEAELARLAAADIAHLEKRAQAWRTAAEIHLAAGDPQRAATHAQAALESSTRAARDAEGSAHVGHARLLLARARLAVGDTAAARSEAARAATALARGLGAEHPLAAEARRLAGSG